MAMAGALVLAGPIHPGRWNRGRDHRRAYQYADGKDTVRSPNGDQRDHLFPFFVMPRLDRGIQGRRRRGFERFLDRPVKPGDGGLNESAIAATLVR
jgi:hypothetical protein